ncbi:MAG TPA: tryptophan-rich sensory protein [archaeon]|nr:tryptophan-rich sensory protein [archaeon]
MVAFFVLLFCICLAFIPGIVGSFLTSPQIPTWYATLTLPAFAPPGWLFMPVWTFLYLLMGVALFKIWKDGVDLVEMRHAYMAFGVQWVLNLAWSFLFFTMHWPLVAFIEIILLWISILATMYFYKKVSPLASFLMLPYLLWVTFAAVLNGFIWVLNP